MIKQRLSNSKIVEFAFFFLKSQGVKFIKPEGDFTLCEFKSSYYLWSPKNPFKLYLKNKDNFEDSTLSENRIDFFRELNGPKNRKFLRFKEKFKELWKEKCSDDLEFLLNIDDKELYQVKVNTKFLGSHSKEVNEFLNNSDKNYKILKIQSPMASKKTNIINELYRQAKMEEKSILFITNRISLAKETSKKYPNVKLYLNGDYRYGDDLIVQFDSLWKYNIESFDIVIIDEITSLLSYIAKPHSNNTRIEEFHYRDNLQKFLSLDQFIDKIVICDAFILYNPFEDNLPVSKVFGILNEYREELPITEYTDKFTFFSKIFRTFNKEFISFSSNEKRLLTKIERKLKALEPGARILNLTSETIKIYDFELIEGLLKSYDGIFYSPVITNGVSFFHESIHFHYDNSSSIDPINSIQMIRRLRNAKEIHFYLEGKASYKTTDIDIIEQPNYSWILEWFRIYDYWNNPKELTFIGKRFSKILLINNILENTHKYSFKELLKFQFKNVILNEQKSEKFSLT